MCRAWTVNVGEGQMAYARMTPRDMHELFGLATEWSQ